MKAISTTALLLMSIFLLVVGASASPIIANHTTIKLSQVPLSAITLSKENLHIAYWHTSHGSQITTGMSGLMSFSGVPYGGSIYTYNSAGTSGALDLREPSSTDLGNSGWATVTRNYLNSHTDVNVVMWSWCGQVSSSSESDINNYLSQMNQLESDYPNVKFVYMTGHLDGGGAQGNLNRRNEQIRAYAIANNKILFDFADIESYDPDGLVNYMKLNATDNCDYILKGVSHNWATEWQESHTEDVDWYSCTAAHSQPLNANQKAYAAWWLWARLAGWDGSEVAATKVNPTISVISPNGGESWTTGTAQMIKWSYTGEPGSHVKIQLMKSDVVVGNIKSNVTIGTSGVGSYLWSNAVGGTTGSDLKIRVQSRSQLEVFDTSDSVFTDMPVTYDAEVVSTSIPATMVGGQSYPVTVTMKNTGSTTWTAANYIKLGARDNNCDSLKFGMPRHYLPTGTTVTPGEQYTFTFTMTAPTTSGIYHPGYRMVWEGHQWFGDSASATINIV